MSSITRKTPVTLTVDEVETLAGILTDFSREHWAHARRTKSAAIRSHCETRANQARDLEDAIVRRLYVTETIREDLKRLDAAGALSLFPDPRD